MAVDRFPIPGIMFFVNGNPFSGSFREFNYIIKPIKADTENGVDAHFEVFTWYGKLSSELSERQAESNFALDTDGLAALRAWLEEQEAQYRAEQ